MDGRCAYVIWHDPSPSVVGQDCSYNTWNNYTAWDQQGNSDADFDLCGSWNCSTAGGYFRDSVRGY
ncbi:MAG: hypothetical protein ACRDQ7_06095 [Haloechinothrix sp.]